MSEKLKLALFVHDYHLEIGHSNALIEMINHFPQESIESVKVVAYTCSSFEKLHPHLVDKCTHIRIPFPRIKPFLLKNIFFQFMSFLKARSLRSEEFKIGIGVAALNVDIAYTQYIHEQWRESYLPTQKYNIFRYFYKSIVYWYLKICENWFYKQEKIKVVSASKFMEDFIKNHFNSKAKVKTVYSGVNLERFKVSDESQSKVYHELKASYPELESIDINKPIILFVGALERKGAGKLFEELKKQKQIESPQVIVIGDHERGRPFPFPKDIEHIWIRHTDKINLFYALSDAFIFPTMYEPFGLVILEAYASGMQVFVTKKDVGASELIGGEEEVYFVDEGIDFSKIKKLSTEEKLQINKKRMPTLENLVWDNQSKHFYDFIRS